MALLILANLAMLGSSRLAVCIRLLTLQGILLGFLPVMVADGAPTVRMLLLMTATIALKGVMFPWLLMKTLRDVGIKREMEPFVGYTWSVLVGLIALAVASRVEARLEAAGAPGGMAMSVALFMILTGLFLIAARRKALSQILGYIVIENGMYALSVVMLEEIPALVELGILMEAFVAVFVMGIAIYHIRREFDHMDADQLNTLKG